LKAQTSSLYLVRQILAAIGELEYLVHVDTGVERKEEVLDRARADAEDLLEALVTESGFDAAFALPALTQRHSA
jgi:hypothetical protein